MARPTCEPVTNCDAFKGDNAKYLPQTTYSERMSLFAGPDQVDLYHFGRGHTDGDTFVVFKTARTMHTGDMFQRKGLPFIDVANGNGSATEFGSTLENAVAGISDIDTVIPRPQPDAGHLGRVRRLQRLLQRRREQGAERQGRRPPRWTTWSPPTACRDEYSDFAAPEQSLRTTVQYVFDGR